MAKFIFNQDTLHKVWFRDTLEVEAESKEEAIKILRDNLSDDAEDYSELGNVRHVDSSWLIDTAVLMGKKDNNGRPTLEILGDGDGYTPLATN